MSCTAQIPQQDSESPHNTLTFQNGNKKGCNQHRSQPITIQDLNYWVNKGFSILSQNSSNIFGSVLIRWTLVHPQL